MNQLSWIIYWADVLPNLATGIGVVSVLSTIVCTILSLIFVTQGFGEWTNDPDYNNRFRIFPYLTGFFLFLAFASNLVPSKDTFYLIAASEAGEQAIKTPEFSKIRQVIDKWLNDQLSEEKKQAG